MFVAAVSGLYAIWKNKENNAAAKGQVFSSLLYYSPALELSDTQVYGTQVRALLGTASHFCEVVVLKLRSVPIGTGPAHLAGWTLHPEP